jgi:steroid delta-isomerase-like uncharacterized protein
MIADGSGYNPRMALTREKMREVIIEHVEAENAHDAGRVLATYARKNPVFEDVAAGVRYEGGEAIVFDNYRHLWDGFPRLKREIVRWTFGDDAVVIELRLRGRHEGAFRGTEATGRDLDFRIIAHFQFNEEGRIAQETAYYDRLTFMKAIGR